MNSIHDIPADTGPWKRGLDPKTLVEKGVSIDLGDPIIIRQRGRVIDDLLGVMRQTKMDRISR